MTGIVKATPTEMVEQIGVIGQYIRREEMKSLLQEYKSAVVADPSLDLVGFIALKTAEGCPNVSDEVSDLVVEFDQAPAEPNKRMIAKCIGNMYKASLRRNN